MGTLLTPIAVASPALAVDARTFNAGHIVSDANFYDSDSMTAAEVQAFLDAKGNRCSANCLKSYSTQTVEKAAQAGRCNGYRGGLTQTAAQIIDGIARSCGISQKALLVILEKEQSLVTRHNPSDSRYRAAMGQGCPDTAQCDAVYYGFFNQVYGAARQFKIYAATPSQWWYRAGQVNSILHHPNPACGRKSVYIENQATAGLYIYTPYTPNDAALNAQFGEGDDCSSYGNRNFFMFWSQWFGNPLISGPETDIAFTRTTHPSLGAATEPVKCGLVGGGCRQTYEFGAIYWTPTHGAEKVDGGIWGLYQAAGGHSGYMGYPIDTAKWSDANGGGWVQNFANGGAYWSTVGGGHLVSGNVYREFLRVGGPTGDLGWPRGVQGCGLPRQACAQDFQLGVVYWTPAAGAVAIRGGMKQTLDSMGGVAGVLGYPTGFEQHRTLNGGGWVQAFEGGAVYWRNGVGVHMYGGIRDEYVRQGYSNGHLGWPLGQQACDASGCVQRFGGGDILWTPQAGAQVVSGPALAAYERAGREGGVLGFPTGPLMTRTGNGEGHVQAFQRGAIYIKGGQGYAMWGGIREEHARHNWNWGDLGWPKSEQVCGLAGNGCKQSFDSGDIYWTPATGTLTVMSDFRSVFDGLDAQSGVLGYPLSNEGLRTGNGTGTVQAFTGGAVYARSGAAPHAIYGAIREEYARHGYNWGSLGWPVSAPECGLADEGCRQQFDNGWIVSSRATGGVRIDGGLRLAWVDQGAEEGVLGYPTAVAQPRTGGGWSQQFQHGVLAWTAESGGFIE